MGIILVRQLDYKEGKAAIRKRSAFLNPVSRPLRDISVALVSNIADRSTTILDPTAATGIRGIRYYLETSAKEITLLDINKGAYRSMKQNLLLNKVRAKSYNTSVQEFASSYAGAFDIIDLDPFGSAVPYVNDLMRLCKDGTYLFVTATDTAVLCGAHASACVKLYNAKSLHNELCHEVGTRILIAYIATVAAQYNFGIDVMLAISYGTYVRLFLRLRHGANAAVASLRNTGYAHYCKSCGYRGIENGLIPKTLKCPQCRSPMELAGRLWTANLYEKGCVRSIAEKLAKEGASAQAVALVNKIAAEPDAPLYYSIPAETKRLGISSVRIGTVLDYLKKNGYAAALTHFDKDAIKTNADIKHVVKAISTAQKRGRVKP